MRRIGIAVRVLLVIALFRGCPRVCRRKGLMMGWLRDIYRGNEHEEDPISR